MRSTVAVWALVLLAVGASAHVERECSPGETKAKDCNTCFCTASGNWGCTRKACPPAETVSATDGGASRVRRSEGHCEPNKTFKKACNTCTCNKDGTAAVCTLKACLSRSAREVSCTPGERYKDGCNFCLCRSDGKPGACTKMACPTEDSETTVPVSRVEQHCEPNKTFNKDCNKCTCNKDGTAAVCTLKACPPRSTRDVPCTPGEMYKEQCNTCVCMADGKSGACTRKACPPGTY